MPVIYKHVLSFRPTDVVFNFKHQIKLQENNASNTKEKYPFQMDISDNEGDHKVLLNLLNSHKFLYPKINVAKRKELLDNENFALFQLTDVFLWNGYLASPVPTTTGGVKEWFTEEFKKIGIPNDPMSRITVLCGGHGGIGNDGKLYSGFTNYECLDQNFYNEFDHVIKDLRKCKSPVGSNSCQKQGCMCKMDFKLLNIKNYHSCKSCPNHSYFNYLRNTVFKIECLKYCEKQTKKLLDDIGKDTTVLVIGWCYSLNGDVCMALRSDAVLSRMILEAEMREIGIKNAKLNSEQKKFLQAVTDRENNDGQGFKDFFLHGKYFFKILLKKYI